MELPAITKLIDADTVWAYAEITADFNPIHVDPDFAATTPMGRCIAHGMLSLNLIWQSVWPLLNDRGRNAADLEVRFRKPVFVGDTVTASGRLDEAAGEDGMLVFHVSVARECGESAISGTLKVPAGGLNEARSGLAQQDDGLNYA